MTCIIQDKDHYFNLDHIATIREVILPTQDS